MFWQKKFLSLGENKIIYNFMIFVSSKNGRTKTKFSPLLMLLLDPGWVKIRGTLACGRGRWVSHFERRDRHRYPYLTLWLYLFLWTAFSGTCGDVMFLTGYRTRRSDLCSVAESAGWVESGDEGVCLRPGRPGTQRSRPSTQPLGSGQDLPLF